MFTFIFITIPKSIYVTFMIFKNIAEDEIERDNQKNKTCTNRSTNQ